MRKIFLIIMILGCLFAVKGLQAQCSVTISTNTNTTQLNCTNTSITLTANSEGTLPITYLWDNNETGKSITVTTPGTYEVTIKATGGCTTKSKITITQDITEPNISIIAFPERTCAGETATLVALGANTYVWQPPINPATEVVTVNPTTTTTYTVTGTALNGCTSSKSYELVVNPLPTATIAGTTSVCQNAAQPSITFSGQNGTKPYTFSYTINGGATQTIQTSGESSAVNINAPTGELGSLIYHLISVADSNNCAQPQNAKATVQVLPAPILTSLKTETICNKVPYKYEAKSSADPITKFKWNRLNLPPGISGDPSSGSGVNATIEDKLINATTMADTVEYVFEMTTGNGCISYDTLKVIVSPTPVIIPINDTTFCNGNNVNGITLSSLTPGAVITWSCSESIGFGLSGTGNIPGFSATNNGTDSVKSLVTVKITTSGNNCPGPEELFNIVVLPAPLLVSTKDTSVCDNVPFHYTAKGSAPGLIFNWKRDKVVGIDNPAMPVTPGNTINERLDNLTTDTIKVKYVFYLTTPGLSCITEHTVVVTVDPTPVIIPINDATFCNGANVKGIDLSSTTPGSLINWECDQSIGFGLSGTGNIPGFVAINGGSTSIKAKVTVSIRTANNNCNGRDTAFFINVLPAPVLSSTKDTSICNETPFLYTAKSLTSGVKFAWKREAVAGISNPAQLETIDSTINETLNNTTDQPVEVDYVYTLSTPNLGCITTETLKVMVNPTPEVIGVSDKSYCNGEFVSDGITFSSISPNARFSWKNNNPDIGLPEAGVGHIPAFNATNPGSDTIRARIIVTSYIKLQSDSCAGKSDTFIIKVLPAPVLSSQKIDSICDGTSFHYSATSSIKGTTFSWVRKLPPSGLTGDPAASNGNTGIINDVLDNTTEEPLTAEYVFTLTTPGNGCITIETVRVTVNPTPVISPISAQTFCSGYFVTGGIPFNTKSPRAVFSWTNSDPTIGLPASGNGNILPFNASNTSSIDKVATITVTVKASSDSCAGLPITFTITVRPELKLTSPKIVAQCDSSEFRYHPSSSAINTTFYWKRVDNTGILPTTRRDSIIVVDTIRETLFNTTRQAVEVKYAFELYLGNSCKTADTVSLTVYPTPIINPIRDTSFCNETISNGILLQSITSPSSITWTNLNSKIGLPTNGIGDIPSFSARNDTTINDTANIQVAISVNNGFCRGPELSFKIIVYPTPKLSSPLEASVCDNKEFFYIARSLTPATKFNWKRDPVAGISDPGANALDSIIRETLNNIISDPVSNVRYSFTLTTPMGNCTYTEPVIVTVNPTPVITPIRDTFFCQNFDVKGITFSSTSPNPVFSWKNNNTAIGLPSSGTGNIPPFTTRNRDTNNVIISATIWVYIKASRDSCAGDSLSFRISVYPEVPRPLFTSNSGVINQSTLNLCSGSENINFNINNPVQGITYRWEITQYSGQNPPPPLKGNIKDVNSPNTVVSFPEKGSGFMKVTATDPANGSCSLMVFQAIEIDSRPGIDEQKIFLKQPGNLLIYPDNRLTKYQWGYDSILTTSPDSSFGRPISLPNQVFQFFTPEQRFITGNQLDTLKYAYWVALENNDGCKSRVYFNGPYKKILQSQVIATENPVELLVFPNPNKGTYDITLKGNIYGNINARIYNALGQQVFTKKFVKMAPEVVERFNTSQLQSGIYFIELYSSDLKKVVTRFIIQH
jgi:Secretion system C-terminal sorting domain/PKD-like domain